MRRAYGLSQRLANRQDWPSDLTQCRSLPEVKAFRATLAFDAGPALVLLHHARMVLRASEESVLEDSDRRDVQEAYDLLLAITSDLWDG